MGFSMLGFASSQLIDILPAETFWSTEILECDQVPQAILTQIRAKVALLLELLGGALT